MAGPSAVADTVEAGDDGDVHLVDRRLEEGEMGIGAEVVVDQVGQESARDLGEALGAVLEHRGELGLRTGDLFLEDRREHHRADAGVGERLHAVDRVGHR